ncbi:MAG: serine/threonine protein kinase [Lachnospiraceae bacterium]|nr:serine/threonine protein kinase [Lachnospiraceae bacterium]
MTDSLQSALSDYETIATLNRDHHIELVQHRATQGIYVKKQLAVYNTNIFQELLLHPVQGVPKVIDYEEVNGCLTVIETYISGTSLDEILSTADLEFATITKYAAELCDILIQLHAFQPPIVHRDIKPSNIIITEQNHVVLIDFNAAKQFCSPDSNDTVLIGTKGYAAPEQYGFGSSSPKTDIYAMGVLLKELTASLPDVPAYFTSIINKCIELNPNDRYQTVSELKAALLHNPSEAPEKIKRQRRWYDWLLLPGFRGGTVWKILVSLPCYILLFTLCLSLEVKDTTRPELWVERFFCLTTFLSIILGTFNYMGIHKYFLLCRSKDPLIRVIGIILLDVLLASISLITMLMVQEIFFP